MRRGALVVAVSCALNTGVLRQRPLLMHEQHLGILSETEKDFNAATTR